MAQPPTLEIDILLTRLEAQAIAVVAEYYGNDTNTNVETNAKTSAKIEHKNKVHQ